MDDDVVAVVSVVSVRVVAVCVVVVVAVVVVAVVVVVDWQASPMPSRSASGPHSPHVAAAMTLAHAPLLRREAVYARKILPDVLNATDTREVER